MAISEHAARRSALDFLIAIYGSQTELASRLNHPTLTQQTLSAIHHKKRRLQQHEARDIEKILGIPDGWMDKDNWVRMGWQIAKEYQTLEPNQKAIANRMVAFALEHVAK